MPPGWHKDPWNQAQWRWFDGHQWTGHVSGAPSLNQAETTSGPAATPTAIQPKKPALPSLISWPVALTAVPTLGFLGWALSTTPIAVALGLVPLFIVMPVLMWIDRTEPEPRSAKIHTFLWGMCVAGFISVIVNTVVAITLGEVAAAVVSAPLIEESTKALGIVWMVRRKEVDGPIDGVVYAGWVALGFAMIENVSYFQLALDEGLLVQTFVVRALLTPFAHPLFTMWIGLAIGLAVRSRRPLWTSAWGLVLAIALHAAWNGTLTFAETETGAALTVIVVLLFVGLFVATAVGLQRLNARDAKRYRQLVPFLSARYEMSHEHVALLLDRKALRTARASTANRKAGKQLVMEARAMNRLAALFDHDQNPDSTDEARLVSQLSYAQN